MRTINRTQQNIDRTKNEEGNIATDKIEILDVVGPFHREIYRMSHGECSLEYFEK